MLAKKLLSFHNASVEEAVSNVMETHLLMMMVSVRMPYLGLEPERTREKVRLRLFRALHW